jgi:uncharacterized protein YcnI
MIVINKTMTAFAALALSAGTASAHVSLQVQEAPVGST